MPLIYIFPALWLHLLHVPIPVFHILEGMWPPHIQISPTYSHCCIHFHFSLVSISMNLATGSILPIWLLMCHTFHAFLSVIFCHNLLSVCLYHLLLSVLLLCWAQQYSLLWRPWLQLSEKSKNL